MSALRTKRASCAGDSLHQARVHLPSGHGKTERCADPAATRSESPDSGQGYRGRARPLAFPFVILAQARLVLFHLRLHFTERLFATGARVRPGARGVQRPGR